MGRAIRGQSLSSHGRHRLLEILLLWRAPESFVHPGHADGIQFVIRDLPVQPPNLWSKVFEKHCKFLRLLETGQA